MSGFDIEWPSYGQPPFTAHQSTVYDPNPQRTWSDSAGAADVGSSEATQSQKEQAEADQAAGVLEAEKVLRRQLANKEAALLIRKRSHDCVDRWREVACDLGSAQSKRGGGTLYITDPTAESSATDGSPAYVAWSVSPEAIDLLKEMKLLTPAYRSEDRVAKVTLERTKRSRPWKTRRQTTGVTKAPPRTRPVKQESPETYQYRETYVEDSVPQGHVPWHAGHSTHTWSHDNTARPVALTAAASVDTIKAEPWDSPALGMFDQTSYSRGDTIYSTGYAQPAFGPGDTRILGQVAKNSYAFSNPAPISDLSLDSMIDSPLMNMPYRHGWTQSQLGQSFLNSGTSQGVGGTKQRILSSL
jgi:hypothetical protein